MIAQANKDAGQPTPVLTEKLFNEFRLDGTRESYQKPFGIRMTRLRNFVFAEGFINDGSRLSLIETELNAILDEPSWIQPAHAEGRKTWRENYDNIDLAAGERAWDLATADWLLGDSLKPETRARIRKEVRARIFTPYLERVRAADTRGFWFMNTSNNWNGVCNAQVVGAALLLSEPAAERAEFIAAFEAYSPFPENIFTDTTVQVMSEDTEMKVWLYGDLARPAGKIVLDRVNGVNIEDPTFIPNSEKFINGYLSTYVNRQFYVIQGHPPNWSDARWVEFVRLIDYLAANNVPIVTPSELAASLAPGGPGAAPSITSQPTGVSVIVGNSATFSVAATGTPIPTYQWFKGATPIQGAVNTSYTISQTTSADAGSYSVMVSNSVQSITSDTVTLTLTDSPPVVTQLTWATSAAGTWDTATSTAWNPGPVTWNNANHDAAIFNGSAGYTITLGTPITVDGMEVNITTGNFLLQSSVLILSGATTSNVKVTAVNALATISSAITGNSGLTKTGSGGLQLSSASNNYTGDTTMNGGSLRIGVSDALSTVSAFVMTSGTLEMQGNNQSVTALSGSANNTIRNRSNGTSIVTVTGSSTATYAGVLHDAGIGKILGFKVAGINARQTLSNANSSYSGTTTVSAGTLIAGASSLTSKIASNTPVTVNSTTDLIALSENPLADGDQVIFSGTTMPGGVTTGQPGTRYYVVDSTPNNFKVSATLGGAVIDLASTGTNVAVSHYIPGAFGIGNSAIILGDVATTANQSSASLLTGGAFTIGRAVTIANQTTDGIYTIGGNTSNTSVFSGPITSSMNLTVSQASGGTLNITGGITGADSGIKAVKFNNTGTVNVSTTGISDGITGNVAVEQSGIGTTVFYSANTYTGDTTISGGTLAVNGSSIADTGKLIIAGGTVHLSGAETVKSLFFGAIPQAAGVYSATGDGDTIASAYFSGDGTLIVTSGPGQNDPYTAWIASAIYNTPPLSTADKLPAADPDADGLPNLIEFATNGNPVDGSDHGKIAFTIQDLTPPAGNELNLVVAVLVGASFGGGATATVGGVTYTVEGSLDFSFPQAVVSSTGPFDNAPAGTGLPNLVGSDWKYHCFKLNASEGLAGKGFLRLKVTQP